MDKPWLVKIKQIAGASNEDDADRYEVPDSWTGDPQPIYVSKQQLDDSSTQEGYLLSGFLEDFLKNGDRVLVIDGGAIVGELTLDVVGNIVMKV